MTRTEIQRRELEETARHNKEMETIGTAQALASGIGAVGSLARGTGGAISGVASAMKGAHPKDVTNNQYHYHDHYHAGKGR